LQRREIVGEPAGRKAELAVFAELVPLLWLHR